MRTFVVAVTGALGGLAPAYAQAHLIATGMGPIYDGLVHFSLSVEDLLPLLALAFLAGVRGPRCARVSLAILTIVWFLGGAAAFMGLVMPAVVLSVATAVLLISIGALLAANVRIPIIIFAVLGVAVGFVRGLADCTRVPPDLAHGLQLLGAGVGVFVIFALAASLTLSVHRFWMIVATRVVGSWLAALGLLLAGWVMRYGPQGT